ncbi:trihelix transcription factor GT-3b-like [Canna indica]|uniref:Trihelix transcription factor GT-3b-like n=1 Tax=Canna indica TaxID=4628 RepID=A0AAQ3KJV2_9LILI|nr:trihelix transcription factor GT-3b-like [Canna indica]
MEQQHHHHQQRLNPPYQAIPPQPQVSDAGERFPQWSHDETRELLAIRSQLDKSFSETKRNKPLWEATSSLLRQKGFHRTPDQCKSKWKNLVTRFKGSESEIGRQFPFYDEMRKIFSDRMERLLAFEKEKGKGVVQVQAKESTDEEEEDEVAAALGSAATNKKKRKKSGRRVEVEEVEVALREFMRRQLEMEARWLEAAAAREAERRAKEDEWRRAMESLREERMAMERQWREREEERRARAEARAERRHALLVALLEKLAQKDP